MVKSCRWIARWNSNFRGLRRKDRKQHAGPREQREKEVRPAHPAGPRGEGKRKAGVILLQSGASRVRGRNNRYTSRPCGANQTADGTRPPVGSRIARRRTSKPPKQGADRTKHRTARVKAHVTSQTHFVIQRLHVPALNPLPTATF